MEYGDKNPKDSVFASGLDETIEGKAFILKFQNSRRTVENYLALKRPRYTDMSAELLEIVSQLAIAIGGVWF